MSSEIKPSLIDAKALRLEYAFDRGVNFGSRTILILGEIDDNQFARIDVALTEMENDANKKITIRINSPGGSLYDAMAIVGRIRASKCRVDTECYGMAMSAALLILASGQKRKISRYATGMEHEIHYELTGKHEENMRQIAQSEKEQQKFCDVLGEFTKLSGDEWREKTKDKDIYFTPQELLELGVVDEII